jgi:hypothetical protein
VLLAAVVVMPCRIIWLPTHTILRQLNTRKHFLLFQIFYGESPARHFFFFRVSQRTFELNNLKRLTLI